MTTSVRDALAELVAAKDEVETIRDCAIAATTHEGYELLDQLRAKLDVDRLSRAWAAARATLAAAEPVPREPTAQATIGESLLRNPVVASADSWHKCGEHDWLGQIPCPMCNMVVTRDGKTVADQAQAIRDFAEACRVKPPPADDLVRDLRWASQQPPIGADRLRQGWAATAIDALTAEVAELTRANEQLFRHGERMYADRETAERRAAASEVDAGRYRWLRDLYFAIDFEYETGEGERPMMVFAMPPDIRASANLDATIDAAIYAQAGKT